MPISLQAYSFILLALNPYLKYLETALIFIFGYIIINSVSGMAYQYALELAERATAMTLKTIIRIAGIALLLAIATSIFNVNPAAALTVGSFGGLVIGYATQTVLSHVLAGIFLLLTRPFTFGDIIKVGDQKGRVKEIKLMHVILEADDNSQEDILIPSGNIVTQIIRKKSILERTKSARTFLTLEKPPLKAKAGEIITFKGKLSEEQGKPLGERIIKIIEIDLVKEKLLASSNTDIDGNFTVDWKGRKTDLLDNTVEIRAIFEGDKTNRPSISDQYTIIIQ